MFGDFLVLAITHQALVATLDKFLGGQALQRAQGVLQGLFQRLPGRARITVRATKRFIDHAVDQTRGF